MAHRSDPLVEATQDYVEGQLGRAFLYSTHVDWRHLPGAIRQLAGDRSCSKCHHPLMAFDLIGHIKQWGALKTTPMARVYVCSNPACRAHSDELAELVDCPPMRAIVSSVAAA